MQIVLCKIDFPENPAQTLLVNDMTAQNNLARKDTAAMVELLKKRSKLISTKKVTAGFDDTTTQSVGQKYFQQTTSLGKGIALGFKYVLASKMMVMMASGTKKGPVIKKAMTETISNQLPASLIRLHPNSEVLLDEWLPPCLGK